MDIQTKDTLKSYFLTGKYPTEEQFASLIDSLVHKTDSISLQLVEGLTAALNGKANKTVESKLEEILKKIDDGELGGKTYTAAVGGGLTLEGDAFAIDKATKQAMRSKMCTIDFGQEEDTVSVAIMNANTKIVKVKTQNVAELRITYGSTMQQAVDLSAEVLDIDLGTADFMVIKITRTSDEQGALVGFTFNI